MTTKADEAGAYYSKVCTDIEMAVRQWVQLWTFTDKYGVQHHHVRLKVRRECDALKGRISEQLSELEKSGMKKILRIQALRLNESMTVLNILGERVNNTGVDQRFTHDSGGHSESGYQHSTSAGLPSLGRR